MRTRNSLLNCTQDAGKKVWSVSTNRLKTGKKDLKASEEYIRNQQKHHQVKVIDCRQKKLNLFLAETGVRSG